MGKIYIDIKKCNQLKQEFVAIIQELKKQEQHLYAIIRYIRTEDEYKEIVDVLETESYRLTTERENTEKLFQVFCECIQCYEKTESSLQILDIKDCHLMLDVAGLIPEVGAAFDAINVGLYLSEGNMKEAIKAGLAFIPMIGMPVGAGRVATKLAGNADDIGDVVKTIDKAGEIAETTDKIADVGKYTDDIIEGGADALNNLKPQNLMDELASSGVKYNPDDVITVTKTADGKLVWLENGTDTAGLNHIITEHADDFLNKGITQEQIL